MLKDLLDYLSRVATFSSNIGVRLLSTILIGGDLKDLLLKFAYIFSFSTRIRSINNIAINYKRIYSRILAVINSFLELSVLPG